MAKKQNRAKVAKKGAPKKGAPEAPKKAARKKAAPEVAPEAPKKAASDKGYRTRAKALVDEILRLPGGVGGVLDRIDSLVRSASAAGRTYEKDHWGKKPLKGLMSLRAADTTVADVMPVMGALYSVTYETAKGEDKGLQLYEHRFAKPKPFLCYVPKQGGMLVIAGGTYKVTERGIEG